jgi:hypothetical protein
VLVHDLVGDIGSAEGMVPFIEDAKRRLLTPDAVHIPHHCTTFAVLGEDPKFGVVERALSWMLRDFRRYEDVRFVRFFGYPRSAALSRPHPVEDLDLAGSPVLRTDRRIDIPIERGGLLRGVLFFIRLSLGPGHAVDSWAASTTWSTPFVRLETPTRVRRGDVVELRFESDLVGGPNYRLTLTREEGGQTRELGQYAWEGD